MSLKHFNDDWKCVIWKHYDFDYKEIYISLTHVHIKKIPEENKLKCSLSGEILDNSFIAKQTNVCLWLITYKACNEKQQSPPPSAFSLPEQLLLNSLNSLLWVFSNI